MPGGIRTHEEHAPFHGAPPYLSYDHCSHGLCGAHLLRDITFIIDAVNPRWARRMKKLLRDYARRVATSEECILTDRELRVLRQQYRTILTQAKTQHELPPVPPRTKGQRGPVAKPASVTLWQRLKTREADILRFAHDPAVAFTNNRAERDLRMAKVKQKVTGVRLLPKRRLRQGLLQNLQLPPVHGLLRLQPLPGNPHRPRRTYSRLRPRRRGG